jgi:hypothetical protein
MRAFAPLFAALALYASPFALGDERGDTLVRQAAERLTGSIPFVISYTIVVSKDGKTHTWSSGLVQGVSSGRGGGMGTAGPNVDFTLLSANLWPLPAFNGLRIDPALPILSSRYAGKETVDGKSYDVVEVTEPILRASSRYGEPNDREHPLARARLKWYLDDQRFLRRVHLVRVEPALDAAGKPLPLPAEFQGDISGQGIVTELRKPRILAPRHDLPGRQRTLPEYVEPGQNASSFRPEITISPDGSLLARRGNRSIEVLDVATGKPRFRLDLPDRLRNCAFSPDSAILAVTVGAILRLYSTKQSAVEPASMDIPAIVIAPSFSPDGLHVASGCADGSVRIWNTSTGALEYQIDDPASLVAFSPDGKRLATFGQGSKIQLWDTQRWEVIRRLDIHVSSTPCLAFSPDAKWIAVLTDAGEIRLFDGSTEQAQRTWKGIGPISQLRWSENSAHLITVDREARSDDGSGSMGLTIWIAATCKMRDTFALPWVSAAQVWDAQVSPDGKHVFFRDGRPLVLVMNLNPE